MKKKLLSLTLMGIVTILADQFLAGSLNAQTLPINQTTPGNYSFVASAPYVVIVECWGAGGQGQSIGGTGNGHGGGGGGYSKSTITLTAGDTYQYTVGNGGSGADHSSFQNTSTATVLVRANGGGDATGGGPGSGAGTSTPALGTLKLGGGAGASAQSSSGGGGGSSAGTVLPGVNATGNAGAIAPAGGGNGGAGGAGSANDPGDPGNTPGGGGGGAHKPISGGSTSGGVGGNGRVVITLACVAPAFNACPDDITASNDEGECSAVVSYTATATGTPAPTITYEFSGLTVGSGSGTGSGSAFNVGTTTVTITATNDCGTATCTIDITVNDDEAPVIDPQASDETVECDGSGNLDEFQYWLDTNGGASATDNCTEEVFWTYVITDNSGDCGATGSTKVTFTAEDEYGNSATTTATFTIEDTTPPSATCQDVTIYYDENGNTSITAEDVDNGSSDVCGSVTLEVDQTEFDCSNLGDNVVTLTVTDDCGLTSTCTATVTVTIPDEWRCGHDLDKVIICHLPPQWPAENPQTNCVSLDIETLCDHLNHSNAPDHLGPCTEEDFPLMLFESGIIENANKAVHAQAKGVDETTAGGNENVISIPNPFKNETTIHFGLSTKQNVSLRVFNNMGLQIVTLYEGELNAGVYEYIFNASGLVDGLYYYSLTTGKQVLSGKLILAR